MLLELIVTSDKTFNVREKALTLSEFWNFIAEIYELKVNVSADFKENSLHFQEISSTQLFKIITPMFQRFCITTIRVENLSESDIELLINTFNNLSSIREIAINPFYTEATLLSMHIKYFGIYEPFIQKNIDKSVVKTPDNSQPEDIAKSQFEKVTNPHIEETSKQSFEESFELFFAPKLKNFDILQIETTPSVTLCETFIRLCDLPLESAVINSFKIATSLKTFTYKSLTEALSLRYHYNSKDLYATLKSIFKQWNKAHPNFAMTEGLSFPAILKIYVKHLNIIARK